MKRRLSVAAMAMVVLILVGCGGSGSAESKSTPNSPSDIEAAAEKVVKALDELGIDHTEPVRAEVGLSGAKARFEMTINGFDAGINVFADREALSKWQELSDSVGGIHVAFDDAALSLNSSEGTSNSAKIAPRIAEAIGGEARGV